MGRHGNTFCPRRAAKNGNCNFLLSTKGHEGPRRTATATAFFVHEGARRAAKNGNGNCNFFLSTKGHEGPRRTATATFVHEGLLFVHEGPRRAAKNGNCNTLLSTKGHEGPRRTATATPFVHGGPLGAAENFLLIHGVRGVSGEESGVRGRSGRLSQGAQGLWRGRCAFWWLDDL